MPLTYVNISIVTTFAVYHLSRAEVILFWPADVFHQSPYPLWCKSWNMAPVKDTRNAFAV